jgi:hypothetical protein
MALVQTPDLEAREEKTPSFAEAASSRIRGSRVSLGSPQFRWVAEFAVNLFNGNTLSLGFARILSVCVRTVVARFTWEQVTPGYGGSRCGRSATVASQV